MPVQRHIPSLSICFLACLLSFLFISLTPGALFAGANLTIDKTTLQKELKDAMVEKLFSSLTNASEKQLKDATYFNELVRDMAPAGIKLDEQNFAEAALGMYNKYKEAIEEGKTPEEAKDNVKKLIKGDVGTLILQSLDSGSQEIVGDLGGLYERAQAELAKIKELNRQLEEDPTADWTKLARDIGVQGEFLDKLEKMEGGINDAVGKYGDYYEAGKIIYRGMSGHSGDKIESLFELGATFGGKIPVLGTFVELYFKVAQEMLKATGRLGKLLQARQQGCVGVGTVGWIQTITSFTDDRNVTFSKQFPNVTACPANEAMEFYKDVYEVVGSVSQLYFWTGSGFVVGKPKGGGIEAVKALRSWLRSNEHVDKASDMKFIARSYNFPPGFLERQKNAKLLAEDINKMISGLGAPLYCLTSEEFNDLILDKGGLQEVIDTSDEWISTYSWRFTLPVQQVVDRIIEDRYIKERATFYNACLEAQRKLQGIVVAKIHGEVFEKKPNGDAGRPSGVSIVVDPMDRITEKCSTLVTDQNGFFKIVLVKEESDSFSLNLKAEDETDDPPEVSVAISGDKKTYTATLTIQRECKEDEELDDEGNCIPSCTEGEERNDQGICVPPCKENEERDDKGNCVTLCKDGEERDENGDCVPVCKEGEERDETGKCVSVCEEGQELNADGKCVPACKENEKRDESGNCVPACEEGQELNADGKCVPACKKNEKRDESGNCVPACEEGQELNADGKCVPACKENEKRDESGNCVPACEEGQELNADGKCVPVCKENEKRDSAGNCYDACGPNARVSKTDPNLCDCFDGYEAINNDCVAKCKPGEERDPSGKCVPPCKENEKRDSEGNCYDACGANARVSSTDPNTCECLKGYEVFNDDCVAECQEGEERNSQGKCVQPCAADEERDSKGECVPVCGSNEERAVDNSCACISGFERNKDGVCQAVSDKCTSDSECPTDYECNTATGGCQYKKKAGCTDDSECPKGYGCNSLTGECVFEKSPPCISDADCSTGYTCNQSTGDCVFTKMPGCKEIGCPKGYECNTQTDECQYVQPPGCQETGCPKGYECNSATGECQYQKQVGCRSDNDCKVGYVCNQSNGNCVSPFDENYTNFGGTLGEKDDERNQSNTDQAASDNKPPGSGSKFTSDDLDSDIDKVEEEIQILTANRPPEEPPAPPSKPPQTESPPTTQEPPEKPPEPPATTPPPATSTGIDIEEVGTAPEGQCLIVSGQLVPVKGYKEQIAGMTLTLSGAVNQTTTSSGSGSFSFELIPAGSYVIAVTQWNYGMTKQGFTAPSGKAIKITLKGSCPYLYVWDGEKYEVENDIYSVARIFPAELMSPENRMYADRDGLFLQQVSVENISERLREERSYRDYYVLKNVPTVDEKGLYRMMVKEQEQERSLSDVFELWAIDHENDEYAAVTRQGRLLLHRGLHPLPVPEKQEKTQLYNNDILEIDVPREAFDGGIIAFDWQGFRDGISSGHSAAKGRPKVALQRLGPDGMWQVMDWAYPRDESQTSYFALDEKGKGWDRTSRIRLIATSCNPNKYHKIGAVSWGLYLHKSTLGQQLSLFSAMKSTGEDVRRAVEHSDDLSAFLAPSESVALQFKPTSLQQGRKRTFLFVSQGVYVPMPMVRLGMGSQ